MLPAHWNVVSEIRSMLPLSTEIPWIKSNIFLPPAAARYGYYTQVCMEFTSLVTDRQARYPMALLNRSLHVRLTYTTVLHSWLHLDKNNTQNYTPTLYIYARDVHESFSINIPFIHHINLAFTVRRNNVSRHPWRFQSLFAVFRQQEFYVTLMW
jgi:hypothetical protein